MKVLVEISKLESFESTCVIYKHSCRFCWKNNYVPSRNRGLWQGKLKFMCICTGRISSLKSTDVAGCRPNITEKDLTTG